MSKVNVYNLIKWVEDHQEELKPPVGNKEIYPDGDFIVMVVAGPNSRQDYHYNEGPEFFYQIKGDIILKIIEDGNFEDVEIKEGEIYLLSPKTPHSPQRPEGTVGLVIEERRKDGSKDGFQWYCDQCHHLLFADYYHLEDIEKQLPETFEKFYNNTAYHTCHNCGKTMDIPKRTS